MGFIDQLSGIYGVILDMDGVLWKDSAPIGDLSCIFEQLRARQLKIILATNNSTRTVDQYLEKLFSFGVRLEPEQIVSSAMTAGYYLKNRFPQGGFVYVVGEQSLKLTLQTYGFQAVEQLDEDYPQDDQILAVVAAMDRALSYDKLRRAALLIRKGVPFIGTNPDQTFPTPQGLVPGAGSILAALETATSVKPLIMGKPAPYLFELSISRMGIQSNEALVVGDRLDTDIAGGQRARCRTAIVLSGVTSLAEAQSWQPAPDLIVPDLASLIFET